MKVSEVISLQFRLEEWLCEPTGRLDQLDIRRGGALASAKEKKTWAQKWWFNRTYLMELH